MKVLELVVLSIIITCISACGKNEGSPITPQQSPHANTHTKTDPIAKPEPVARPDLFDLGLTPEQMRNQRINFLQTQAIESIPRSFGLYYKVGVDVTTGLNTARIPGIAGYGDHQQHRVAIKLPSVFRKNIPKDIITEIRKHPDIEDLDVFFAPQSVQTTLDVNDPNPPLFGAHFWLAKDYKNLGETLTRGPFNQDTLVGIFDLDPSPGSPDFFNCPRAPLARDRISTLSQHIHDNLISPPVGCVNLTIYGSTVSFYSLIISEHQHRAAVTLHWILINDWLPAGTYDTARQPSRGDLTYPIAHRVFRGDGGLSNNMETFFNELQNEPVIRPEFKEKLAQLTRVNP